MREIISMQTNGDTPTVRQAFDQFIREKKIMNLSEDTIKSYECTFKTFTKFFPADNICKELSTDVIFQFIEFLQARNPNIKTVTINTYLREMRTIIYSFMEKGYMERFKIKMLKCEKELKETYSYAELERLLKKPDRKKCCFSEYRNWVMVCYLLGTGNRLRTMCNVKIGDIDFENHEILLKKLKNKKQYAIPLAPTLEKTLTEYLQYRKGEPDDYLFCTQYKDKLCRDTVTTAIYRYNRSRGVTKTSVHLFRHTFAKNWILSGGDIFRLQSILGHSSIEIVKEYVNMFGVDLKRDFDKFNPLENMKSLFAERKAIDMKKSC